MQATRDMIGKRASVEQPDGSRAEGVVIGIDRGGYRLLFQSGGCEWQGVYWPGDVRPA